MKKIAILILMIMFMAPTLISASPTTFPTLDKHDTYDTDGFIRAINVSEDYVVLAKDSTTSIDIYDRQTMDLLQGGVTRLDLVPETIFDVKIYGDLVFIATGNDYIRVYDIVNETWEDIFDIPNIEAGSVLDMDIYGSHLFVAHGEIVYAFDIDSRDFLYSTPAYGDTLYSVFVDSARIHMGGWGGTVITYNHGFEIGGDWQGPSTPLYETADRWLVVNHIEVHGDYLYVTGSSKTGESSRIDVHDRSNGDLLYSTPDLGVANATFAITDDYIISYLSTTDEIHISQKGVDIGGGDYLAPSEYILKGESYGDNIRAISYYDNKIYVGGEEDEAPHRLWEYQLKYDVDFNSQGGSAVDSQFILYGDNVDEPSDPTLENHTFLGWYKEDTFENEWDFENDIVTEDTTLYALFLNHLVTFDSQGGSDVDDVYVADGDTIPEPDEPTLQDFNFVGWYTDEGTWEELWNFDTPVHEDITLYARWEEIVYHTVTFDVDGGTPELDPVAVEDGTTIPPQDEVTKEHYTFVTWTLDGMPFNIDTDVVTSDITLRALWEVDEYNIFFIAEGAEYSPDAIVVPHGELIPKPAEPPYVGYKIVGWFTESSFENEWDFSTDTATDDMILYAQYEPVKPINEVIDEFFTSSGLESTFSRVVLLIILILLLNVGLAFAKAPNMLHLIVSTAVIVTSIPLGILPAWIIFLLVLLSLLIAWIYLRGLST